MTNNQRANNLHKRLSMTGNLPDGDFQPRCQIRHLSVLGACHVCVPDQLMSPVGDDVFRVHGVLMASAGKSMQIRNVLGHTVKTVFSYAKRNPALNAQELVDGFTQAFYLVTPLIHKIDSGELPMPEGKNTDDLTRLIGGFLAGDKSVIEAADRLRLIEYQESVA